MALYIPQSILHLARSLYVSPETYGPNYVHYSTFGISVYGQLTLVHSSSNVCRRQARIMSGLAPQASVVCHITMKGGEWDLQ